MGRETLVQGRNFVSAPYKFFGFACKTCENYFIAARICLHTEFLL